MSAKLKVFTFNLRVNTKVDGNNNFFGRTDRILDCIREYQPDLIGFQEANNDMRAWLIRNLTDYMVVGCGREKNYRGESTVIAYKKDVFELISLDNFWLSAAPHQPGSRYGADQSSCPRICTSALLKHIDCEKPFYFYNTHLDHQGKTARLLGALQVLQYVSERPEKFIMTGDFNALPDAPEIKVFTEQNNGHTVIDATARLGGTFHAYGAMQTKSKIDYIFTDAACDPAESFVVPDEGVNGIYISDHHPVCAYITMD